MDQLEAFVFIRDLEVPDIELSLIDQYDNLQILENGDIIGTEGLSTILIKTLDTFIGILNNIKGAVFGKIGDIKRSELMTYIQSHKLQMKKLKTAMYTDISQIKISIPTGVKFTYPETIDVIAKTLTEMSILDYADSVASAINELRGLIVEDQKIEKSLLKLKHLSISSNLKEHQSIVKKIIDIKMAEKSVTFRSQFGSINEYSDTIEKHLNTTKQFNDIRKLEAIMSVIEEYIDIIIAHVQMKGGVITKQDIREIAGAVHRLGNIFETFGKLMHCVVIVDHNLTLATKVLIKEYDAIRQRRKREKRMSNKDGKPNLQPA